MDFHGPKNDDSAVSSALPVGRLDRSRLLVVEDDPASAAVLEMVLGTLGYPVRLATSAAEAIRLAETEEFALVVSDIGLPGTNGYELMANLRDRFAMKGIAMTGYGMNEDIRLGLQAGFSEHIVKPVDVEQLEEAIRRVLGIRNTPLPA